MKTVTEERKLHDCKALVNLSTTNIEAAVKRYFSVLLQYIQNKYI